MTFSRSYSSSKCWSWDSDSCFQWESATFSGKGQWGNISDFVGHTFSVPTLTSVLVQKQP